MRGRCAGKDNEISENEILGCEQKARGKDQSKTKCIELCSKRGKIKSNCKNGQWVIFSGARVGPMYQRETPRHRLVGPGDPHFGKQQQQQ